MSDEKGNSIEKSDENTEWWWVDYLENEMDPAVDKDLELLLEHSHEDRLSFERIRVLREWLKGSDPAHDLVLQMDGERLNRVRDRIMNQIYLDSGAAATEDTNSLRV
jgi:hypothetical protein